MSAYQVGNVDVLTVIGSFTTVPNYETDYYRELTNYQTSLGTLVAEAHRGSIEVQSTPGTESIFRIRLPLLQG